MSEETTKQAPFNISPEVEARFAEHFHLWQKYKRNKEQPVRFFNKGGQPRGILEYVRDSVDRMNEYHLKPANKEAWQSNVFDPVTRDKLITILSKIASARMKAEVIALPTSILSNKGVKMRSQIFSDLLNNANKHNRDQYQLVWEMYTAMSEGTVFGFESWKKDTREVEYVKEYNPETGEKVTETIKHDAWDDVYGEILQIQEVYPETIWMNAKDFKDNMKRCFIVKEITYASFKDIYGKFKNASEVEPAGNYINETNMDYGVSSDVDPENVQVIQFFDSASDKMGIWANGKELYYGCLPWNHKRLPIWIAIFEPIHHSFLFGKSLPDKLMSMQDINNGMFNAMLDQLFLALNSPIFVNGEMPELDDGFLEPGRIYEIGPNATVQRTALGAVDQTAFNMLNLVKRSIESTSVSDQAQGIPTGGRKTKFEVQQLNEASFSLAGLFITLMESAMVDKYSLRLPNLLQYYSMPSNKKSGKKQFKFITIENTKLSNGKIGKKMIQIVDSKAEVPQPVKLADMANEEMPENFDPETSTVEPIVLSRDYLLNGEYDHEVIIVPNSSIKQSEADKAKKDITFYQATAQNPQIDQEQNLKDFARAFGKDESMVKPTPPPSQDPLAAMMGGGGQPQPAGAAPQGQAPSIDMEQL